MAQVNFGMILREARERKGYDLATAARRLRIRPDILRAIEENDFSRMPPRGYARNMVNAYARLVGLNPTEMTRMYLDEAYAYQVGRVRTEAKTGARFDMGAASRRAGSSSGSGNGPVRPRERAAQQEAERPPRQNALGRTMYDDRREYVRDYGSRAGAPGRLYSEDRTHPSRHAALPNGHYTNFYAGPKAPNAVQSKLPFIIAGGVILILLVLVLVLAFGGKGGSTDDAPKVPITGVTDTTQSGEGSNGGQETAPPQEAKPVETAPTKVTVEYKVATGKEVYAVITADGTQTPQMITGPVTETVDVTGTWSFATWVVDAVTITVDGKTVSFDGKDASDMPQCTVDFQAYLEQWKADHPDAASTGSSTSTGTGSSSSTATGATGSTGASTE